ncbi:MAG TPA: hypothetical protein PLR44_14570 [Thermomicrobiales bacterium]|nr:hypothetical protein [Thermomicrobiales bacterium]HRA33072.1 hypothetical protein [Thermomicrobiales bacterium]
MTGCPGRSAERRAAIAALRRDLLRAEWALAIATVAYHRAIHATALARRAYRAELGRSSES